MKKKLTPEKALKAVWVVFGLFVFGQFAAKTGEMVANLFSYVRIDPYGQFMWKSVQHLAMLILALCAILILRNLWGMDFGLRIGGWRLGLISVCVFSLGFFVCAAAVYWVQGSMGYELFYLPFMSPLSGVGTFFCELVLIPIAEELLYRALPIGLMWHVLGKGKLVCFGRYVYEEYRTRSWQTIYPAGIVAAVLFALAQIRWSAAPFAIEYDSFKIMLAFVTGIIYAKVYERTESIIYPIMMHGMANVITLGLGYLCSAIF